MGVSSSSLSATNVVNTITDTNINKGYGFFFPPFNGLVIGYPTAANFYSRLQTLVSGATVGTVSTNIFKGSNPYTNTTNDSLVVTYNYALMSPLDFDFPIYPLKLDKGLANFSSQYNVGLPLILPSNQSTVYTNFIVTNSTTPKITGYQFSNQLIAESDGSVTDQGMNGKATNVQSILMPWDPTNSVFTQDSNVTYTYSDLQKQTIIRGGSLTANRTDTFDIASTILAEDVFTMGSGSFRFFIQNVDPTYDIILSAPAGFTFVNNVTIGPGKTGIFVIRGDVTGGTCELFTNGIVSRTG